MAAGGTVNGSPRRTPRPPTGKVFHYRPTKPASRQSTDLRLLTYISFGVLGISVAVTVVALASWWGDATTRRLVVAFVGATVAVAGAMAGIALVPLGLSRGKRGMWVAGLVVGVASFAVLIGALYWAAEADRLSGG